MLIKKRKLISVNGGRSVERILQPEHAEINKTLQLEIQKAKQEAKQIKSEAKLILAESEQKLKQAEAKIKEIMRFLPEYKPITIKITSKASRIKISEVKGPIFEKKLENCANITKV